MKKFFLSLTIVLILFAQNLAADVSWEQFSSWKSKQINHILNVGNDVWVATQNGILKFDGVTKNFVRYTTDDGLLDNTINTISIDKNGVLWVGTDKGISSYNGSWKTEKTTISPVISSTIDGNNNKWFLTEYISSGLKQTTSSLIKYDGENWEYVTASMDSTWRQPGYYSFNFFSTRAIAADKNNNIWVTCDNSSGNPGYCLRKYNGSSFTNIYDTIDLYMLNKIAVDNDNNLWMSAMRYISLGSVAQSGIIKYNGTGFQNITSSDGLASDVVYSISVDTNNVKWFATKEGISKYDGNSWVTLDTKTSNYTAKCVFGDGKDGVYAGSTDGLHHYDGAEWTPYTPKDCLGNDNVYSVAQDASGMMWFGTYDGLSCYDGASWRTFTQDEGLYDDLINSITIDRNDDIYLSARQSGFLVKFDRSNFTPIMQLPYYLGYYFYSLATDLDNVKWCGLYGSILKYDGVDKVLYPEEGSISCTAAYSVAVDNANTKWIGGKNKVSSFDGTNWTTYTQADGLSNIVSTYNVVSVAIDNDNTKWFATLGAGVSSFNGSAWATYSSVNGLPSNNVYCVAVDKYNIKWFGTDKGIVSFNGTEWKKLTYENMPDSLTVYSIFVDKNNKKWFCTLGYGVYSYLDLGINTDVEENDSISPSQLSLTNYPNPFNLSTAIRFSVSFEKAITLDIYNVSGQKITELVSGKMTAGSHSVTWDGKDSFGNVVSSGIYIASLRAGNSIITRKMLLIK